MTTHTPVTLSNTTSCVTNKVTGRSLDSRHPGNWNSCEVKYVQTAFGHIRPNNNKTRNTGCRSRLTLRVTTIFLHVGFDIFKRQVQRMPTNRGIDWTEAFPKPKPALLRAKRGSILQHRWCHHDVFQPYRYSLTGTIPALGSRRGPSSGRPRS